MKIREVVNPVCQCSFSKAKMHKAWSPEITSTRIYLTDTLTHVLNHLCTVLFPVALFVNRSLEMIEMRFSGGMVA